MISDMLTYPTIPDNLQTLTGELEKLLRLVNNATMPSHLDTAENFLDQFTKKWQLDTKKNPNAITVAIGNDIIAKRIEMQVEDMEHANNSGTKSRAI
jgi:hypothetical protein